MNKDVFEQLRESSALTGDQQLRVLVMDDIVGTQRTFTQLVEYFQERLGEAFHTIDLRFVFPCTPREATLTKLQGIGSPQTPR